jgi:hypothetical protein
MIHSYTVVLFVQLTVSASFATPVPGFSLSDLVHQSDVIVVGQVNNLKFVETTVSFRGSEYPGRSYESVINVDQVVKATGEVPATIQVNWEVPLPPSGSLGVRFLEDGYQILFLKRAGNDYRLANEYYPSIPAHRGEPAVAEDSVSDDRLEFLIQRKMCTFVRSGNELLERRLRLLHRLTMTSHPVLH